MSGAYHFLFSEMKMKLIAEEIFRAGINAVLPSTLIPSQVSILDNTLIVGGNKFSLDAFKNIFVIGAGKASAHMALEIEKILGGRISNGHIITKYGHSCNLKYCTITEAAHPVPDDNGFRATGAVIELASAAESDDLVICLISGGGSALFADFPMGSNAEEIMLLNDLLVNSGASIIEINTVRKHLSEIKGGQLARLVYPATLVSLIISDVPGDPAEVIASGPTVPDNSTFKDALNVLEKYDLQKKIPSGLLNHLKAGIMGSLPETPDVNDHVFARTLNILAGTNNLALKACREKAVLHNLNARIISRELQGETTQVAKYFSESAFAMHASEGELKPVCLIFGGETTVKMTGTGRGGRNQHLALQVGLLLGGRDKITFLSGGTDGNDGNTDVAGAVVDNSTIPDSLNNNIDPEVYLRNFDSYSFFKQAGGHIYTGPTMTNVMDIYILIIE